MNWKDEDLDATLRGLKDEELPAGATEAVRARVLAEVSKPKRGRWWLWGLAPAAAAAIAVVMVGLGVGPWGGSPVEPPPLVARAPGAPKLEAPLLEAPQTAKAAPAARAVDLKPVAAKPETVQNGRAKPEETEFVKLITDDPDVVILWAMDSKGEAR